MTLRDHYTKAAIVLAVRHGVLSRSEACERYEGLSVAELRAWEMAYDDEGIVGLRTRVLSACPRRTSSGEN